MNYCTICHSVYSLPGTCNCYTPVRTWMTTSGYLQVGCPACGRLPCDRSTTGCPIPVDSSITVTARPDGDEWVYYDAGGNRMQTTPTGIQQ